MKSLTGCVQLKLIGDARVDPRPANADLVGRIFSDGYSDQLARRVVRLPHARSGCDGTHHLRGPALVLARSSVDGHGADAPRNVCDDAQHLRQNADG